MIVFEPDAFSVRPKTSRLPPKVKPLTLMSLAVAVALPILKSVVPLKVQPGIGRL